MSLVGWELDYTALMMYVRENKMMSSAKTSLHCLWMRGCKLPGTFLARAPQQPIEPAAPFEAPTAKCYVEGARPRIKMSEMPQLTV